MSKENVEIVERLFEAVERRDRAGVLAAYDENIVIREAESLHYGGTFQGHAWSEQTRRRLRRNLGRGADFG